MQVYEATAAGALRALKVTTMLSSTASLISAPLLVLYGTDGFPLFSRILVATLVVTASWSCTALCHLVSRAFVTRVHVNSSQLQLLSDLPECNIAAADSSVESDRNPVESLQQTLASESGSPDPLALYAPTNVFQLETLSFFAQKKYQEVHVDQLSRSYRMGMVSFEDSVTSKPFFIEAPFWAKELPLLKLLQDKNKQIQKQIQSERTPAETGPISKQDLEEEYKRFDEQLAEEQLEQEQLENPEPESPEPQRRS